MSAGEGFATKATAIAWARKKAAASGGAVIVHRDHRDSTAVREHELSEDCWCRPRVTHLRRPGAEQ